MLDFKRQVIESFVSDFEDYAVDHDVDVDRMIQTEIYVKLFQILERLESIDDQLGNLHVGVSYYE